MRIPMESLSMHAFSRGPGEHPRQNI